MVICRAQAWSHYWFPVSNFNLSKTQTSFVLQLVKKNLFAFYKEPEFIKEYIVWGIYKPGEW